MPHGTENNYINDYKYFKLSFWLDIIDTSVKHIKKTKKKLQSGF